jgi:hypothetical protein
VQLIWHQRYRVRMLWNFLDERRFAVPELQREFVWDAAKACKLLDSIYKKLPIGDVLVWETGRDYRHLLRQTLHILPPFSDRNKKIWFLMDGQQRLSVLHQVRSAASLRNAKGKTIDFSRFYFSLDCEDPIRFVYRRRVDPDVYASLSDLLSTNWVRKVGIRGKKNIAVLRHCREAIASYPIPFTFVRTCDVEEVRESFIRINAQGTPVSAADKAFARATNLNLRHLVHEARTPWPHGFNRISEETILLALALSRGEMNVGAVAVDSAIARIEKAIEQDNSALKRFTIHWRLLKSSLGKAIDYLHDHFGAINFDYLPYPNMVATLGLFFFHNRAQPNSLQRAELKKWFWATAVGQRYAGAGFRRNILEDMKYFGKLGRSKKGRFLPGERIRPYEIRRTEYGRRSALTTAYFCLLLLRKPQYLANGQDIPEQAHASIANRKDKHHVFPRNLLRRSGISLREINSLCNICFLVAEENQSFGNRRPASYLSDYASKRHFGKVLGSHLIPSAPRAGIWDTNVKRGFRTFIDQRLKLICREFEREAGTKLFAD